MQFTTNLDQFKKFFLIAGKCISPNDVRPVLQAIKVTVDGDEITLSATDMDNSIRMVLKGEGIENGSSMIPARLVSKLLANADDDVIEFKTDGNNLVIIGERSRYSLPEMSADEFPEIQVTNFDLCHEVQPCDLIAAFDRTLFAIDRDSSKFALGGVCVSCDDDTLTTVSTDGRRLATQEINAAVIGGHSTDTQATIVAPKTISILKAMLAVAPETVDVKVEDGKIYFDAGDVQLTARLIQGRFPKWQNILPDLSDRCEVSLMTGTFLQALRQAQVVTTETQPGVLLSFKQGELTITSSGAEKGKSEIKLPISYDCEPIELKVDPVYLIQGLATLPKESIVSVFIKSKNSILVQWLTGYQYVVMPLA